MKKNHCPHNHIVGQAVEFSYNRGQNIIAKCIGCGQLLFCDAPQIIRTPSGEYVYLCADCRKKPVCSICGKKIRPDELYLGECIVCGQVFVLCGRCKRKRVSLDITSDFSPEEIAKRLYAIIDEIVNRRPKRKKFPWFSFWKKKKKGITSNFPLIMNINMYFTDADVDSDFYDDTDIDDR